jgi:hypothetical protein
VARHTAENRLEVAKSIELGQNNRLTIAFDHAWAVGSVVHLTVEFTGILNDKVVVFASLVWSGSLVLWCSLLASTAPSTRRRPGRSASWL